MKQIEEGIGDGYRKWCGVFRSYADYFSDHLDGQRVTALEDGGPGMLQSHEIDVRCHHGNEIFRVDVDRLR